MYKNKSMLWFLKIHDRQDALDIAESCGIGFLVLGAIQGVLGLFLSPYALIDAAIYAVCGYFIKKSHSRTAAVVALFLSLTAAYLTFLIRIGSDLRGGRNIILAILAVWAAIRSIEATFKLHGRFREISNAEMNSESCT